MISILRQKEIPHKLFNLYCFTDDFGIFIRLLHVCVTRNWHLRIAINKKQSEHTQVTPGLPMLQADN